MPRVTVYDHRVWDRNKGAHEFTPVRGRRAKSKPLAVWCSRKPRKRSTNRVRRQRKVLPLTPFTAKG
jgi:hypothetical protein